MEEADLCRVIGGSLRKCELRAGGQVGEEKERQRPCARSRLWGQAMLEPEDHRAGFCIYSRSSGKWGASTAVEGRSSMIRSVFGEEAGFLGFSVENGLKGSQKTDRKAPRSFAAM